MAVKKKRGETKEMEAEKILVVDDEARMRKLVKDFLTIKGFTVIEAEDGEQAVDMFFKQKDISLIILDVMMAKIQAVLRRTYDMAGRIPVLEHQGAVLNLSDTTLTYQGKHLELTRNEFRILQTLLENKGKVVSREALMTKLWQMDCYVEENTLTVNVTRLRKKLESIGLHQWIRTKVGSGYWIPAEGQA